MAFRIWARVRLAALIVTGAALLAVAPQAAVAGDGGPPVAVPASWDALGARLAAQQAELILPDGAAYDYAGCAVALDGDTAVVGARGAAVGGTASRGAVYVFVRSGGIWTLQATLAAADGAAGDRFGYAVAIDGDTVAVGADVGGDADEGAVYVFTRSGGAWTARARLSVSAPDAYPAFGCSVALSGDTLVAGAHWSDVAGAADQGVAYVFTGSGETWTQQARLTAAAGQPGDHFGTSVAVDGDTAVVGADVGGAGDAGAAYVFTRGATTWSERTTLAASDGAPLDQFGVSVALSGGTVLVGAQRAAGVGASDQGAAYVFTGGGSAWSRQARLTDASSLYFGSAVAFAGETAVVGAAWDDGGGADRGAAYVYRRSGSVWVRQARLTASNGRSNDRFGFAVAASGDAALVGAPAEWLEGRAYVYTDLLLPRPAAPRGRTPKGLISSRTPTLRWAAAVRAATYEVRVLKGSRVLARRAGLAGTSWRCATRLPRSVWLAWQVRASNAAGTSAWSAKLTFKVR